MSSNLVPLWNRIVEMRYANADNFAFRALANEAVANAIEFVAVTSLREYVFSPHVPFKQAYHNGHNTLTS